MYSMDSELSLRIDFLLTKYFFFEKSLKHAPRSMDSELLHSPLAQVGLSAPMVATRAWGAEAEPLWRVSVG
jgi:hypothetical protein